MSYTKLQLRLPPYARDLLAEAVGRTGYPLVVAEQAGINYDSLLRMGGPSQPYHQLTVTPPYRDYLLHFLVTAAAKIRRMWDLPPGERLVPVSDSSRRLPEGQEEELRAKFKGMPEAAVQEISTFLYRGVTQQLTSMPVDIRVEREIALELPDHREAQRAYLVRQVHDLEPHFSSAVARFAPDHLYAACSAMNVVLAGEAAEIAAVEPGPMFSSSPHWTLGERLRNHLLSVEEPGFPGDRLVTDLWAEELDMRDWYDWRPLDEMR